MLRFEYYGWLLATTFLLNHLQDGARSHFIHSTRSITAVDPIVALFTPRRAPRVFDGPVGKLRLKKRIFWKKKPG